jgi:glycosyltransferase involved in cell wall biosynthesis
MEPSRWPDETALQLMALSASDITIAVTVYDRRQFLEQAISSALNQTISVRVIVVEDCGPDATLRTFVQQKFGSRVEYFRNEKRLGLFGNFNRCIELCRTRYVCILHDDDFLTPTFVEAMIELFAAAPERGLYYGICNVVDSAGKPLAVYTEPPRFVWQAMDVASAADENVVCFPGQLLNVKAAQKVGGFRTTSHFCADWELWIKLALHSGAASTKRVVGTLRDHSSPERGTSAVFRSGKVFALMNAQRKENLALVRRRGYSVKFDRAAIQTRSPLPFRFLLIHGKQFSPRLLRYNTNLFLISKAPNARYRCAQILVRLFRSSFVRVLSTLYNMAR